MDKTTILAAFSVPALLALNGSWQVSRNHDPGFGAIAIFLSIVLAFIAALVTGITLFVLRKRQLLWWHGLLISIGGVVIAIGVFLLFGIISHLGRSPIPN